MNTYQVTWVIDIDAMSPTHAATKALSYQRDHDSTAVCFTVNQDKGDHIERFEVDLAEMNPILSREVIWPNAMAQALADAGVIKEAPAVPEPELTADHSEAREQGTVISGADTAAINTLDLLGYTYEGGELWKPPLNTASGSVLRAMSLRLAQERADLDAAQAEIQALHQRLTQAESEKGGLAGMLDKALVDAGRYRWLREQSWHGGKVAVTLPHYVQIGVMCYSGQPLDDFIDGYQK